MEEHTRIQDDASVQGTLILTPKRNKNLEVAQLPPLRRSPRKLSSQQEPEKEDKVSAFEECWKLPRRSPRKHPSTSTLCPGVQPLDAVNASTASKVANASAVAGAAGRNPAGYSKLTISGSAIVPNGTPTGQIYNWDDLSPQPIPNLNHQVYLAEERYYSWGDY